MKAITVTYLPATNTNDLLGGGIKNGYVFVFKN